MYRTHLIEAQGRVCPMDRAPMDRGSPCSKSLDTIYELLHAIQKPVRHHVCSAYHKARLDGIRSCVFPVLDIARLNWRSGFKPAVVDTSGVRW